MGPRARRILRTMAAKKVALIALLCALQALGSPLSQPESGLAAPLAEGRGLIEDILAAEAAILEFIGSCNALAGQVVSSSSTIVSTVTASVASIVDQLRDLGLSAEEIAEIERLAAQCVTNIENIALELLADISRIIDLLTDILGHLTNPIQLALDIIKLENAIDKLGRDFSTAFSRVLNELLTVKDAILAVLANHTGEIVDNILSDIAAVERVVMAEYHATLSALEACLAAGAATIAALQKIVS